MSINIFAVGDIMLGEQPLCHGFGVSSIIREKGADFLFDNVKNIFSNGDIVFGNLEAPLADISAKNELYRRYFKADPIVADSLKKSYFNVLSIANNHIMEHGIHGFDFTINELQKRNIAVVGIKNNAKIINIREHSILFLSYSFINDGLLDVPYNNITSEKIIIDDIIKYRKLVDLVIVSLHWGNEYVLFPSPSQIKMGRKLIDCGVDVIIGSHPHVLQGYEIYRGKPIIYSLGNFIFDHTYIKNTEMSTIININANIEKGSYEVSHIPVLINPVLYCPILNDKNYNAMILNHIENTRKHIENKTIDEYDDFVSDYNLLINEYGYKANLDMKAHFLKNIHRYPLKLTCDIIWKYLKK